MLDKLYERLNDLIEADPVAASLLSDALDLALIIAEDRILSDEARSAGIDAVFAAVRQSMDEHFTDR